MHITSSQSSASRVRGLLSVATCAGLLLLAGCNQGSKSRQVEGTGAGNSTADAASNDTTGSEPGEDATSEPDTRARRDTSGEGSVEDVDTGPPLLGVGQSCESDERCRSGTCETFGEVDVCTKSCATDVECEASGVVCFEGQCTPERYCQDQDGDGYGRGPGCRDTDCDDEDAQTFPGAEELCGDDKDNDCDGVKNEGFEELGTTCTAGVGACQRAGTRACSEQKTGLICDAEPGSGASEICDGLDNDCDGQVDESIDCKCQQGETQSCYTGQPSTRGVGRCQTGVQTCQSDGTWGECKRDVTPSQETCNGFDSDCNGRTDDVDQDGDGFFRCQGLANRDCDDSDADVHPTAQETCNGTDDNCNGIVDEDVKHTYFRDADGDGFGVASDTKQACQSPDGYVDTSGDCNDQNADINPNQKEVCNDIDDDCDGQVDDGLETVKLHQDKDGDTYGSPGGRIQQKCLFDRDGDGQGETPPIGWSTNSNDCDDSNARVYPGAEELCDGIKNDCNAPVADWSCPQTCDGQWPLDAPRWSRTPRVAQLDNDLELEVVHSVRGQTRVWDHDGTQKWKTNVGQRRYTFADFNRDRTLDIAVGDRGSVHILDGKSGKTLKTIPVSGASDPRVTTVFDLDNDTNLDLVVASGEQVILLNADLTIKQRIHLDTMSSNTQIAGAAPLADPDDDGLPIFFQGSTPRSRNQECNRRNGGECRGRIYAFDLRGNTYNDPNWQDPNKPYFKPRGFPKARMSGRKRVGDFDGDGSYELTATGLQFVPGRQWGGEVWNFDGTQSSLWTGGYSGNRRKARKYLNSYIPADNQGNPTTNRQSTDWGISPVVDMNDDGQYERFVRARGGTTKIDNSNYRFDDSRMPDQPWGDGSYSIADLDNDQGLELLFQNAGGEKLYCYSFPSGTYNRRRILSFVPRDPHGRHYYRTHRTDPYEPNDKGPSAFDPKQTSSPIKDSRAFNPMALRWQSKSGGWWAVQLRGLISTPDDVDYYVWKSPYGRGRLRASLRTPDHNYDLKAHMFRPDGQTYLGTRTSTQNGSKNEYVSCRADRQQCPKGDKLYILEVRPASDQDWGPEPYNLRITR